jgi:Cu2+-exporting ATPase
VNPGASFCCFGCEAVYTALRHQGLMRYYELRNARGQPVGELALERRDHTWIDAYRATVGADASARTASGTVTYWIGVQGIRCAACVWLLETIFARTADGLAVEVHPADGRLRLRVRPGFDLLAFVRDVESLGYLVGPATSDAGAPDRERDGLLLRLGICAALASNSMMFSAAGYFGLTQGPLHALLYRLNFAAVSLAVLVGGGLFVGSATRALRRGVVHLDAPIALSVVASYAGACWAYVGGSERTAYFDSLSAFIALMLLGRYLQDRTLARSRAELLSHDQMPGLYSRRLRGGQLEVVASSELRALDELVVAPGDLVPADAILRTRSALCSLDWIDGEAEPRGFQSGQRIPAGTFNAGVQAFRVRLEHDFCGSALAALLRGASRPCSGPGTLAFAPAYVAVVSAFAVGGGFYFAVVGGSPSKGLEVMAAVAAVSCPCAIGLTIPLARDWMHALLRRSGVFVRSASLLERVRSVRSIAFDKTGTLSTGQLCAKDARSLRGLPLCDRQMLHDMASRSLHPSSIAIQRALASAQDELAYHPELDVVEHVGLGLEARVGGRVYRLGRASWAAPGADGELGYAVDGRLRLDLSTAEQPRDGAREELQRLRALGYEVWLLSGDRAPRVREMASRLALPESHVRAELSAQGKCDVIQTLAGGVLMIGDGLNDAPAMQAALCSATPAIDRALVPGRADLYFTQAGLWPIRMVLQAGRLLSRIISTNLVFGALYNGLAMAVAVTGAMRPWLAAVLMPLSSMLLITHTSARLRRWSRAWTR